MSRKEYNAAPAPPVATQQNEIQAAQLGTHVAEQRVRIWSPKLSPMCAVFAVCFASAANPLLADEVTKWNEVATKAAYDSGITGIPILEARIYAIAFAAVHDALNGIDRRYTPYSFIPPVTPGASPEAAVATAAHDVLLDQFGQLAAPQYGFASQQSFIEAEYTVSLAQIPAGSAKTSGITLGKAAAQALLALRAGDGWNTQPLFDTTYPQGTAPGQYRFTPGYNFALLPKWGNTPPFVLKEGAQFRPPAPYPIDSKRYTQDFNEIKALGGDGVTTPSARTLDQTEIALFWVESSPLMWNRIGRTVSSSQKLALWENARLFALLNLGMADGYIASLGDKYFYNYWRPVTAIREGDNDGNPDTTGDPAWTPLVITPPIPDYDSGHAVEGGTAAGILQGFFRTDRINFAICSTTLPPDQACESANPKTRSFNSFSEAAEENGLSRILVGFHFRNAVEEGTAHGQKIADWVVAHALR
jgi:hypothetical protein